MGEAAPTPSDPSARAGTRTWCSVSLGSISCRLTSLSPLATGASPAEDRNALSPSECGLASRWTFGRAGGCSAAVAVLSLAGVAWSATKCWISARRLRLITTWGCASPARLLEARALERLWECSGNTLNASRMREFDSRRSGAKALYRSQCISLTHQRRRGGPYSRSRPEVDFPGRLLLDPRHRTVRGASRP